MSTRTDDNRRLIRKWKKLRFSIVQTKRAVPLQPTGKLAWSPKALVASRRADSSWAWKSSRVLAIRIPCEPADQSHSLHGSAAAQCHSLHEPGTNHWTHWTRPYVDQLRRFPKAEHKSSTSGEPTYHPKINGVASE